MEAPTSTILVVDDNEDILESTRWLLEEQGFRVSTASTGRESLERARLKPSVILLDVGLPDMDGMTVCQRIKSESSTASIPVLMVSAYAISPHERAQGLECGADGYLTKPVDPSLLLARIRALLRSHKAEELQRRAISILEATTDCFLALDHDWRCTYVNPQAEKALQYQGTVLLGQRLWDAFPEAVGTVFEREYRRAVSDRVSVEVVEYYAPLKTWFEVRAFPTDEGLNIFFRDVTSRRKLEEQYQQAQKMEAVGRLAGGVAHDFNNLLTVINGYGALVSEMLPEDHPAHDLVAEMTTAGERAAGLTRQLLAFSRRQVLAPTVMNLNDCVMSLEKMLRRVIGEDIDLSVRLSPILEPVHADSGQIEQVILNLCVNARDAMPTGGHLTIETKMATLNGEYSSLRPGQYVLLTVSDTGVGMTDEVKAHLFEPFYTTKELGKGTGLGLATVHGVVQQSGGHIDVHSEPGTGTMFKVFLPPAAPQHRTEPVAAPSKPVTTGGTETILVVEDEEAVRGLTLHILQSAGYNVLEAGSMNHAMHTAARHGRRIDLLVTDVVMPGKSGRELAQHLRVWHPGLRVLFVSGYTDDAVVRHGVLEAEMAFLQKPFSATSLLRSVRQVLDEK